MAMVSRGGGGGGGGSYTVTTYECNFCGQSFGSRSSAEEHIKSSHAKELRSKYKCPVCGERFAKESKAQKHFVEKHPERHADNLLAQLPQELMQQLAKQTGAPADWRQWPNPLKAQVVKAIMEAQHAKGNRGRLWVRLVVFVVLVLGIWVGFHWLTEIYGPIREWFR